MMYDTKLRNIEASAEQNGYNTLIPASNMIIVKEAAENTKFATFLNEYVARHEDLEITWTENTAEITVNER